MMGSMSNRGKSLKFIKTLIVVKMLFLGPHGVPLFVEKCIQFIEREGLASEGLYRIPGNRAHVDMLFAKFYEGFVDVWGKPRTHWAGSVYYEYSRKSNSRNRWYFQDEEDDNLEQCQTPLGRTSNCISLYQCPSLVVVFEQNPVPYELVTFLRQSQCGFAGNVPKVCCGPLPNQQTATTTQRSQVTPRPQFNGQADPVSPEDSAPYPRKQCGIDTNGDRIYGGVDTELDEFPWMALLGYQPRDPSKPLTYQCGGVLINRRYVMSAAHCVVGEIENVVGKLTSARLGEYDIKSNQDCLNGVCAEPVQEIAVMSAHPHPGYSDKNTNRRDDISLIRLARRATLTYYIQPICLVDTSLRIEPGSDVFVAGWGKTLSGKSSQVKQKLNLPVFSKHECVAKYRDLGADITDKQLCAGGNFAEDACRGDSGGPLMRRTPSGQWEAVAVVSFGYGCGRDGWPGIYTAIQGYTDWIQNTLRSTNV